LMDPAEDRGLAFSRLIHQEDESQHYNQAANAETGGIPAAGRYGRVRSGGRILLHFSSLPIVRRRRPESPVFSAKPGVLPVNDILQGTFDTLGHHETAKVYRHGGCCSRFAGGVSARSPTDWAHPRFRPRRTAYAEYRGDGRLLPQSGLRG